MIKIVQLQTKAAVGSAGAAIGQGFSSGVRGRVVAIQAIYNDSPPATTDLTVTAGGETILSLADQATDIKVYPRRILEENDGTDLTYDGTNEVYGKYVIDGQIKAVMAQANAGDFAEIKVWME